MLLQAKFLAISQIQYEFWELAWEKQQLKKLLQITRLYLELPGCKVGFTSKTQDNWVQLIIYVVERSQRSMGCSSSRGRKKTRKINGGSGGECSCSKMVPSTGMWRLQHIWENAKFYNTENLKPKDFVCDIQSYYFRLPQMQKDFFFSSYSIYILKKSQKYLYMYTYLCAYRHILIKYMWRYRYVYI